MSINLGFLRSAVQARADMTGSEFNTGTAGLDAFINTAYWELYDFLIASYQNYNNKHFDITLSGQDGYVIPDSISLYKFNGIDYLQAPNNRFTVYAFQWMERNYYQNYQNVAVLYDWYWASPVVYCPMGDTIYFLPVQNAVGNFRIWYIPNLDQLVNDNDAILPDMEKWYNYIVCLAAIKILDSEESDTTALQNELAGIRQRILGFMANRDAGMPKRVADTRRKGGFGLFGGGGGVF